MSERQLLFIESVILRTFMSEPIFKADLPDCFMITVSVTFAMKIRPFKANLGLPLRVGGGGALPPSLPFLPVPISLQHSKILWKRNIRYCISALALLLLSMLFIPCMNEYYLPHAQCSFRPPLITTKVPCSNNSPKASTRWLFQSST